MRAESLASSQSCRSVDADTWCIWALTLKLVIIILFWYFKDFTFYGKSHKGERQKFQDKCLMDIFTARQRSYGKVMFYTYLSAHRGYDVTSCLVTWSHVHSTGMMSLPVWLSGPLFLLGVSVRKRVSLQRDDPVLTSSGGQQSRWYTSYWNAFLFSYVFVYFRNLIKIIPKQKWIVLYKSHYLKTITKGWSHQRNVTFW